MKKEKQLQLTAKILKDFADEVLENATRFPPEWGKLEILFFIKQKIGEKYPEVHFKKIACTKTQWIDNFQEAIQVPHRYRRNAVKP